MNETPATTQELFQKYGQANPAPKIGQLVILEWGGDTGEAAFTVGEITNAFVGGPQREHRVMFKVQYVYFADGRVLSPRRASEELPFHHFAKPIQQRLRERATKLNAVVQQYQQWAEINDHSSAT